MCNNICQSFFWSQNELSADILNSFYLTLAIVFGFAGKTRNLTRVYNKTAVYWAIYIRKFELKLQNNEMKQTTGLELGFIYSDQNGKEDKNIFKKIYMFTHSN